MLSIAIVLLIMTLINYNFRVSFVSSWNAILISIVQSCVSPHNESMRSFDTFIFLSVTTEVQDLEVQELVNNRGSAETTKLKCRLCGEVTSFPPLDVT